MGLLLPGQCQSIVERVQNGDPSVGWRGDPGADVYVHEGLQVAQVWAFDRGHKRYCAAQVSILEPGWEHTLLRKLRDGDWQNPGVVKDIFARGNAREAAAAAERSERIGGKADYLVWLAYRTYGTHAGGLTRRLFPVS